MGFSSAQRKAKDPVGKYTEYYVKGVLNHDVRFVLLGYHPCMKCK